jgi:hypothetical protein
MYDPVAGRRGDGGHVVAAQALVLRTEREHVRNGTDRARTSPHRSRPPCAAPPAAGPPRPGDGRADCREKLASGRRNRLSVAGCQRATHARARREGRMGLSVRAYARHRGVSHTAVQKALSALTCPP